MSLYRKFYIPMAFGALVLGVIACAPISEESCRGGNWESIGFRDGANGRTANHFTQYLEECAKYGVSADRGAWLSGLKAGYREYCTVESAYEVGRNGRRMSMVCEDNLPALKAANVKGYNYFEISQEIDEIEEDMDAIEDRAREINAALRNPELSDETKAALLREKRNLEIEYRRLDREIARLKRERREYRLF